MLSEGSKCFITNLNTSFLCLENVKVKSSAQLVWTHVWNLIYWWFIGVKMTHESPSSSFWVLCFDLRIKFCNLKSWLKQLPRLGDTWEVVFLFLFCFFFLGGGVFFFSVREPNQSHVSLRPAHIFPKWRIPPTTASAPKKLTHKVF